MWVPYVWFLLMVVHLTNGEPECHQPIAFYKELQCTPIYSNASTNGCPERFDCSNLQARQPDKCTYRGDVYGLNEIIPDDKTYGNCHTDCYCVSFDKIECAILDCPEELSEIEPDSHLTYSLNQCCATGVIKASTTFATCKVDGKVYKEGEQFTGVNPCITCICSKDWNNEFTAPFCMRKYCSDEILYLDQIKANGAPVGEGCCPDSWMYADPNDLIISNNGEDVPEEEMCIFGDRYLKIGDQVERVESQYYTKTLTNCTCLIPPFLTCTMKHKYIWDKTPEVLKEYLKESDYL